MNGTDHLLPQPWLGEVAAKANAAQDDWHVDGHAVSPTTSPSYAPPLTDASPRWHGELRSGARANLLMGVTSNRVDVRRAAARAERALEQLAEPASALFLPADEWPDRLLAEAWLDVIRNAAHDSVCACSDDEVVDGRAAPLRRGPPDRRGPRRPGRRGAGRRRSTHDGPVVVNLVGPGPLGPRRADRHRRRRPARLPGAAPPSGRGRPRRLRIASAWPPASSPSSSTSPRYTGRVDRRRRHRRGAVRTARDGGGQLVGPDARAELEALMADGRRTAPCTVRVAQEPGRKVLARVDDLPGYGWRAWSPPPPAPTWHRSRTCAADDGDAASPTASSPCEPSSVPAPSTAATSATPTTGARRGGDAPDELAAHRPPRWSRRARCVVGSASRHATPTATSRSPTSSSCAPASGWCGSPPRSTTAAATTACASTCRCRRRPPRSEAECAFAVVTRGLTAEGGPTELGLPTFPSRRFVARRRAHRRARGPPRVRARRHRRRRRRPPSSPSRCCAAPACSRRCR